ncbi:MAG: hypothetical protein PUH88_09910, partial [Lachnospiraceae bacterium]|nr:hypothetical protein [Lachnospiraceae bacterium]
SNVQIKNEIGHIFRGHNLIEYKSEDDEMNIDTLFKVIAYGCLYKAYAKDVDGISADDITLSLVRKRKPKKLFSYFEKEGIIIEKTENGIYIIQTGYQFPLQFIILGELNTDAHIWLTSITNTLEKEQFTKLLSAVHDLKQKQEREYADAVMEVVTNANKKTFHEIKENAMTYKELLRFFKPDLDDEIDAAILQTTENITQDMTRKTVLRMLKKKKYDYEEIAEIAGTTVDTVKQIEESEIQFVS